MNLLKLKYFQAVCLFQSFSDAAEHLHISQPSLSNAIKELENEYGVSLFLRHYRGVSLTAEGQVLYNLSNDILARSEQAENIMKDLGNERKKLRLGVPPMIGSLILPHIYGVFVSDNKDIELEITEGGHQELVQNLSKDYLDMIILSHDDKLDTNFSSIEIANPEIVSCHARSRATKMETSVTPDTLQGMPLVLFEDSFFQAQKIKDWFEQGNVTPNIILQTKQLSTMLSMISKDLATGFVFKQLIAKNSTLSSIPLEPSLYVKISLVWKKDTYFFHSMERFKRYATEQNPFFPLCG